jgi:hypothetical protein
MNRNKITNEPLKNKYYLIYSPPNGNYYVLPSTFNQLPKIGNKVINPFTTRPSKYKFILNKRVHKRTIVNNVPVKSNVGNKLVINRFKKLNLKTIAKELANGALNAPNFANYIRRETRRNFSNAEINKIYEEVYRIVTGKLNKNVY